MSSAGGKHRDLWIFVIAAAVVLAVGWLGWLLVRDQGVPPGLAPSPGVEMPSEEIPEEEPEEALDLEPASFADLPGWEDDAVAEALPAMLKSCDAFDRFSGQRDLGGVGYAGTAAAWHSLCRQARSLPAGDDAAVRGFFEERFTPWLATDLGEEMGLFTGYYEPTLHGSRRRGGDYQVPLYQRPPELVSVDLGQFRDDLAGRRIAGRVQDGLLVPMPDRSEIDEGAFEGRRLEVVWVDDAVDAFFLHIQGSGLVVMEDGSRQRVGYAGQNGHPYRAIGRDLVEQGHMELDDVSMQSIRAWMESHPEEAREVMALNPSYVFFRPLQGGAPEGAQSVELTPRRSLAVDLQYHPLGVPVWLDASAPAAEAGAADLELRRLLIAQDTGGAIRGPVRGDVFWGPGDEAAEIAGRMRHEGRMWVLLPDGIDPRPAAGAEEAR